MILLLICYGSLEMITLWTNANSTITTNEVDSYFDAFYEFSLDKKPGLQIAFGLTAYDGNYEPIDDPTYVTVKSRIRSWSPD